MANKEDYLDALTAYSKNPSREIPAILEQYLNGVAKNGETLFHWQLLKPLLTGKMDQVIGELRQRLSSEHIPDRPNVENVRFDVMHDRIMDALNKFNGAPFTIQRLCELLVDPERHYRRSDKFLRGLEKNVLVVSTVDPYGRKVISESGIKHLVNGVDMNGSPFFPRDSNITSNLPPVPGWVTKPAQTRPQNTSHEDAPEPKTSDQASTTSSAADNACEPSSMLGSLDTEQKEPLLHSEDVVEETVVTMDTSEAGTVATDGGEAMAEVDDNEEDMTDDTNSPPVSSFSEQPSVSDTGESSVAQMKIDSVVILPTQTRICSSTNSDVETMDTSTCDPYSSESTVTSQNLRPSLTKQPHLPSSEADTSQDDGSENKDLTDSLAAESGSDASSSSSSYRLHQKSPVDNSGFSTSPEDTVSPDDPQGSGSDGTDSCSAEAVSEMDSSTVNVNHLPSSSTLSSSSVHFKHHETAPITDSSSRVMPSCTEYSVADLERFVDSVDTSVSKAPFSSLPTLPALTCKQPGDSQFSPPSSSVDSALDCEKSEVQQTKVLSEKTPVTPGTLTCSDTAASPNNEAPSIHCMSDRSDVTLDNILDSTKITPDVTVVDQKVEFQESDIDMAPDVTPTEQESGTDMALDVTPTEQESCSDLAPDAILAEQGSGTDTAPDAMSGRQEVEFQESVTDTQPAVTSVEQEVDTERSPAVATGNQEVELLDSSSVVSSSEEGPEASAVVSSEGRTQPPLQLPLTGNTQECDVTESDVDSGSTEKNQSVD